MRHHCYRVRNYVSNPVSLLKARGLRDDFCVSKMKKKKNTPTRGNVALPDCFPSFCKQRKENVLRRSRGMLSQKKKPRTTRRQYCCRPKEENRRLKPRELGRLASFSRHGLWSCHGRTSYRGAAYGDRGVACGDRGVACGDRGVPIRRPGSCLWRPRSPCRWRGEQAARGAQGAAMSRAAQSGSALAWAVGWRVVWRVESVQEPLQPAWCASGALCRESLKGRPYG